MIIAQLVVFVKEKLLYIHVMNLVKHVQMIQIYQIIDVKLV